MSYLNYTVCTHIIYYGVQYNDSTSTFYWAKPIDASAVANLTKAKDQYGFKVIAEKGGALESICGSQQNMSRFANAAVKFLKDSNLDGIDFDWEFPQGKWKEPYAQFLKTVRKAFDAAGSPKLSLSMAASAIELLIAESYDIPSFGESLDFLSIMVSA